MAHLIDGVIIGIVTRLIGVIFSEGALTLISIIVIWMYFAGMESSEMQATVGKIALGVRVTDLEGERISFGRATIRYFSGILSVLILCIGFLMVAFTSKKQALHDMIAGTLVVKN